MTAERTRSVMVRFTAEEYAQLKRVALEEDRSVSWMVRRAVRELVDRQPDG